MPGYLGEVPKSRALTASRYRRLAKAARQATGLRVEFRNHPCPRAGRPRLLAWILPSRHGSLYSAEPEGRDLGPFFRHWSDDIGKTDHGSHAGSAR